MMNDIKTKQSECIDVIWKQLLHLESCDLNTVTNHTDEEWAVSVLRLVELVQELAVYVAEEHDERT